MPRKIGPRGPYRDTRTAQFWTFVDRRGPDECWEWKKSLTEGYGNATINKTGMRAHRAAWVLTTGEIPDGLWVLHKCDNRKCCNPAHLFLGTRQDNLNDMFAKGRNQRGEMCPNAKLTAEKVRSIRALIANGMGNREIAAVYGVSHATISDIRCGATWAHVK